jgi:hypothetical protein
MADHYHFVLDATGKFVIQHDHDAMDNHHHETEEGFRFTDDSTFAVYDGIFHDVLREKGGDHDVDYAKAKGL